MATGVSVMGAIVALDGRLHATRPVDDAFGVVRVADVPGVRTYLSHQYVGRTNARGEVVVPNLVSYYGNRLSIDPSDVPLDRSIGVDERIVAPAQRGGALVRFEALRLRPVTGARGGDRARGRTILPAFGDVELVIAGRRMSSPIGVNGEFYIDDLGAGWQRIVVRYDGARYGCGFEVPDQPRVPGEAIDVGTVTCREESLRAGAARRSAVIARISGARSRCDACAAPAIAEAQLGLNCTISTTPVAFGDYNVLSASPKTTTGSVTYQCTLGVNIIVTLSRGSSATFDPRTMRNGAEVLNYNLYREARFRRSGAMGRVGRRRIRAGGAAFRRP